MPIGTQREAIGDHGDRVMGTPSEDCRDPMWSIVWGHSVRPRAPWGRVCAKDMWGH